MIAIYASNPSTVWRNIGGLKFIWLGYHSDFKTGVICSSIIWPLDSLDRGVRRPIISQWDIIQRIDSIAVPGSRRDTQQSILNQSNKQFCRALEQSSWNLRWRILSPFGCACSYTMKLLAFFALKCLCYTPRITQISSNKYEVDLILSWSQLYETKDCQELHNYMQQPIPSDMTKFHFLSLVSGLFDFSHFFFRINQKF